MKATTFAVMLFAFFTLSATAFGEGGTEYDKALKYYDSGQYSEAVGILREYVEKKPEPSAYYRLGYALYKLGRYDEANRFFKQAYLIDPTFSPGILGTPQKYPEKDMKGSTKTAAGTAGLLSGERTMASAIEGQPAGKPEPPRGKASSTAAGKQKEKLPVEALKGTVLPAPKKAVPRDLTHPREPHTPFSSQSDSGPVVSGAADLPMLAVLAGMGTLMLFVELALYIYFSLCLYLIAKKLEVPSPWIAFIPLVQVWTFVNAAGKPWWWILLLLVPVVNFFVGIYLWTCITENLGRNRWLGLLLLLPVINLVFLGILAFSRAEGAGSEAENATPA